MVLFVIFGFFDSCVLVWRIEIDVVVLFKLLDFVVKGERIDEDKVLMV